MPSPIMFKISENVETNKIVSISIEIALITVIKSPNATSRFEHN